MPVRVKFSSDERDLLRGQAALADSASDVANSVKNIARETGQFDRVSTQAFQSVANATARYNTTLERLNAELKAGTITQEEFGRESTKAAEKLRSSTEKAEQELSEYVRTAREAQAADQERGRTAERVLRRIQTPQERYNREIAELKLLHQEGRLSVEQYGRAAQAALGRLNSTLSRSAKAVQTTFSLSTLSQFAGGILGIVSSLQSVLTAFREIRREEEQAAETLRETGTARGTLAQVATSRQDFQQLIQLARTLESAGAATGAGAAEQIVFALRSTGLEAEASTFALAGASGLVTDVRGLIDTADTLFKGFGRQDITSTDELLSQLLVLSSFTQKSAEEIGTATATISSAAKAGGFDFEATGSAIATLAGPQGSVKEARTQLSAFLASLDKAGIVSDSYTDAVEQVNQRIRESGGTVRDVLGDSKEAIAGFRVLSDRQEIYAGILRDTTEQQRAQQSLFRERAGFADADAATRLTNAARAAEGQSRVSQEQLGLVGIANQTFISELNSLLLDANFGFLRRQGIVQSERLDEFFGTNFGLSASQVQTIRRQIEATEGDPTRRADLLERLDTLAGFEEEKRELTRQPLPQVATTQPEQ